MPERLLHVGLMLTLGVAVALAVRVVGSLLVTALLVLPGAAAGRWCRRPTSATLLSVALGGGVSALATAAGRGVEWLPAGPLIVFTLFAVYLASLPRNA